jgi:hypothetical protein
MFSTGPLGNPEAPQPKPVGAWAGYLIFGLFLLVLIVIEAQAAYNHEWTHVAGISVFALAFVMIPTGAWKLLRRAMRNHSAGR